MLGAGCLQLSLGLPPSSSSAPQACERGQACCARPHPGTEPSSATCLHLWDSLDLCTPSTCQSCHFMCQLTRLALPQFAASVSTSCLPIPLSSMPPSCPSEASMSAASPACTNLSTLLVPCTISYLHPILSLDRTYSVQND